MTGIRAKIPSKAKATSDAEETRNLAHVLRAARLAPALQYTKLGGTMPKTIIARIKVLNGILVRLAPKFITKKMGKWESALNRR